ncbi:copper transporter [Corynebacterium freneyi]|uniref:copper transporter n=1 Tax=Corynebacterium freneyi TaxID=134034 RepID=UPI00254B1F86|nr:copper transporter [Corynebacterium freneyi]MDK8767827.1 copper transporter [Corynebacterium freneyi]
MAKKRSGAWSVGVAGAALGVAAGSALGAYVLAPEGGIEWGGGQAAEERDAAIVERDAANVRADAANAVVEDVAARVVDGSLSDVPVLLVTTPDADEAAVDSLEALLGDAGAPEVTRMGVTSKFLSAEGADELKDVATSALPAGTTLDVDRRDPGFQAGQALSPVLLLGEDAGERASVADRRLLLGSLRDAGFIEYEDGTMRPTAAIVVVTGAGTGEGEDAAAGSRILADFAEALSADGTVVVAGDPEAARDGGVIEVLESSDAAGSVATQPAIGDAAGRVGVVRAIVERKGAGAASAGEAPAGEPAEAPADQPAEEPADQPAEEPGAQ